MRGKRVAKPRLSRDHQTYIEPAKKIRDVARKMHGVTMISSGIIEGGVSPGEIRVKIAEETGCILLNVRGVTAWQEIRIYSTALSRTKLELARKIRELGYHICFPKKSVRGGQDAAQS